MAFPSTCTCVHHNNDDQSICTCTCYMTYPSTCTCVHRDNDDQSIHYVHVHVHVSRLGIQPL